MAKYLPLPDGSSMKVPDRMSYAEAMELAREKYPDIFEEPKIAPPAPTVGGQAREFVKGLVPGAIGMVEQAAVGASALLPEDIERAAREKIAGAAETLKRPFAAREGYEESIGRKFGEATGSLIPLVATAPFGAPGLAAAATLGVGAGAGEARTRAEQEGGMGERGTATALGAVVGAGELFAPLRILNRVAAPAKAGAVAFVKRALAAGGEEAAQEAASEAAQNLIAKGLYKPEQEIIEKVGESAAYGGAVGALAQGLLDLTLGRRARGRMAAEEQRQAQAEAARLAQEEEAAKNAPDALRALDAQYQDLLAQKTELDAAVVKPAKGATPEEKQAYQEAKQARDLFVQEQFRPVQQEYDRRKDAIAELKKAQAPAAPVAPAAPAAPEAEKVSSDVQRLMLEQDDLRKQMADLTVQMREQPGAFEALDAQRQQLQRRLDARAALIEEKGGVAIPTVEFEQNLAAKVTELNTKIDGLKKAYPEAIDAQDYDKARKIAAELQQRQDELAKFTEDAARRMRSLQEKQAGMEQRGQTPELFAEMPAQPEEQRPLTFKTPTGKPIETLAVKPEEALSFAQPAPTAEAAPAVTEPTEADKRVQALRTATEAGRSPRRIEELQQELQDVVPTTDKTLDLFSSVNVLRTGIQNNDPVAIQKALQGIERRKQDEANKTRAQAAADRDQFTKAMDERLGLGGEKVTRTATPEQYDSVMAQIETLRNKVEQPQKNAKRSVLQELEDLAAEHAMISNALETGMAYRPSMKDKVAQLNATLGKGEAAPAQRPMTGQERGAATRRLQGIAARFNMLNDTIVAPTKKQIDGLYSSLYERKPVKAPAVERAAKAADLEARARGPQPVSRAAETAARIKSGDVTKEAEASAELRKMALDLGQAAPAYKAMEADVTKQARALTQQHGPSAPETVDFNKSSAKKLEAKALALGRAKPAYKAALAKKVEVLQAALAETKFSKQTVPSQRTPQVTRKVTQAPRKLRTELPKSEAETTEEFKRLQESRQRGRDAFDDDVSTALRKREDTSDATVDAKQAEALIVNVKKELPSNVKFVYAPTVRDVPVRLLNQMAKEKANPADVQGAVFSDGTVLIIGENHANLKDLEATIAHELIGHYGIDTIIGLDRLQAYADKTDLGKLAEEIGGKDLLNEVAGVANTLADMGKSESVQKLQVLREIIAHTEEARVTEAFRDKAGRWIKELVGMVRAGLRRMGFMETAKLSTSDIFYMLRESRKAFADKKIGAYRSADGQIAFRQRRQDVTLARSFIAKEPRIYDRLLGNFMGLSGRVQYVDKDAALSEAFKRGLAKGQITSLEASNAEFALRFGQKVTQYASQFLSHGAVKRVPDPRGPKGAYIYESKPGANMVDVARAVNKGGFSSDTQAEAVLTAYVAGERAKVVGWNKLNFDNPAEMQRQYNEVITYLDANPKAKAAVTEAARIYKEFNDGQIDFLVQMGEMTPTKAAELKSRPYIPYYRIDGDGLFLFVEKERPIRIGNVKDQPELKALVGGNTQIMPIFTSAVQNAFILTRMGLRNQMMKESAFTLQKLGIVSKMGPGKGPDSSNTVRFKVKGEPHFAVIDQDQFGIPAELIVKGMEGIKTATPAIIELMGLPADVLRKFVTRMPVYAIRQIVRDPLNAWLTTGTDTVPVLSSFVELGKIMAGRSEAERRLMATGAISSNVFTGDQRDMSRMLRDLQAGKLGWDKLMAKADAFAIQGDAATRAVIYNDSLAKGMTEQEALLRTMESMNFDRRGLSPSMRALSIMIPFFNAQIQGLDVLYRAFTGNMPYSEQLKIRQKLWSRGLLLAVGTLAYAAMMEDDEAYKRAKPEERLANWFVYVPGFDEPVRVPIPFELGYLFKALPEALYHSAKGDVENKQALEGMARLITQTVPFTLPQAVKPLTEVILGKSFYSGDIESSREQSLLATERYRDTTTGLARMIGSVTGTVGLSPIKIDYLIRGYTGGLGIAITQLANPLVNVVLPKEDVPEPTTKMSKVPLIGGLFQPVEGRGTLDAAYDRMKQVKEVDATFKQMVKDGRTADAKALVQDYANEMAMVSTSGQVFKQLGDLAALERQVKRAPNLTTEQKDARLKVLDAQKERIARMYLDVSERVKAQRPS